MAMITLHFLGFHDYTPPDGDPRIGEETDITPSYIIAMDTWTDPVGTRLRIQGVERDIVVSETKAQIRAMING